MQTLESLGVPASFLIPHQSSPHMPEAPAQTQQAWSQQHQGFNPAMEQGLNQQANHIFVMNNVKPEQQIPRQQRPEEVINSPQPPVAAPSVITATYNPTYNRCLPKILSDLDCEMKIKQVLRCIETILLENGDVDLQQQAYKLPDRSLSPQFSKPKKLKVKDDEDMMMASPMQQPTINLPLATNSPSMLMNKSTSKNPIRINVKVEPTEMMDKQTTPRMQAVYNEQAVPSGSPRGQMFDFSCKPQQQAAHVQVQAQQYPRMGQSPAHQPSPQQRSFSYDGPFHAPQPMIPHVQLPAQLSVSNSHINGQVHSPHQPHNLHTSSPHLHTAHVNSPHLQHTHSPHLQHTHTNSPHLQSPPHALSPHIQHQQVHSPHVQATHSLPESMSMPQSFQAVQQPTAEPHSIPEFAYQSYVEGAQGAFKAHEHEPHHKEKPETPAHPAHNVDPMSFIYDPALVAQYLAQNQQQLQALQAQLQLQQQQYQQQHGAAHGGPPANLELLSHPISLSGHLIVPQVGPDGVRLEEDDKWILSLLNEHDLSLTLSGQIPPPL